MPRMSKYKMLISITSMVACSPPLTGINDMTNSSGKTHDNIIVLVIVKNFSLNLNSSPLCLVSLGNVNHFHLVAQNPYQSLCCHGHLTRGTWGHCHGCFSQYTVQAHCYFYSNIRMVIRKDSFWYQWQFKHSSKQCTTSTEGKSCICGTV